MNAAIRQAAVALAILLVPLAVPLARAAPGAAQGTSTFVPVQVEDALVIRLGEFELQDATRFTKTTSNKAGHDLWDLTPEVKYGVTKRLQLVIGTDYATGNQSGANQGSGSFTATYQFNDNSKYLPAFAVKGGYDTPYGAGDKTAVYRFKAIATKYLGASATSPRLDINLIWNHRTTPGATTRSDQLAFGVAYSMLVGPDTAMVVDYVHGAAPTVGEDENIIDIGFRHLITSSLAISLGGGFGVGRYSPNYRMMFALQQSFQLF